MTESMESVLSELPKVARKAIAASLEGKVYEPKPLPDPYNVSQGLFVTLYAPGKALRGCIGHLAPFHSSLTEEVKDCAVAAATQDNRFAPVELSELKDLEVEISLLGPEESVQSFDQLDPKTYGVIVTSGPKRGVLLPDIDGIDQAEMQIKIAMQKGRISPLEKVHISRFKVTKITEHLNPKNT